MFVVAQLGARMHYAVPSILARAHALECLYTDLYASRALRAALALPSRFAPPALRRWLARVPVGIPEEKIVSFPAMGLEYYWRQNRATINRPATAAYLWVGREFCRRVLRRGLGNAQAVYTFNSAGLELLQDARARGLFAVMEQTLAPAGIEDMLLQAEETEHPGWEQPRAHDAHRSELQERERMEWGTADLILCGSEFVRDGIRVSGGPVERCSVVPYGIRPPSSVPKRRFDRRPLRVLTVGAVGLRKGTPYVLAAARSLNGKAEFRVAGHLNVTARACELLGGHVNLLGVIPRSEIQREFARADVFLLPSICEGSATVCYEALAAGLPVITTPNAGSVVRDGVDGFIVPIRDSDAIIERLERLDSDRDLFAFMSENAQERAAEFTIEKYGDRLLSALRTWNALP